MDDNDLERDLDGNVVFRLTPAQWDTLVELLERPPRHLPGLARLFSQTGALGSVLLEPSFESGETEPELGDLEF